MDILIFLWRRKCDTRPINIGRAKGIPAGYRHSNRNKDLEDGITPANVYAPGSIRLIWAFGNPL